MGSKIRLAIGVICIIGIGLLGWWMAVSLKGTDYDALGKTQYNKGNYNKAITLFTEAIGHNPSNADAYWNRGNTYAHEDTYFHHYNKLPGQTYVEAGLEDQEKAFQRAVADFKKAMELDPSYAALAHFGLGNAYYLYYDSYRDRADKVIPEYKEAIKGIDQIEKKMGRQGLAIVYTDLGRTYLSMCELDKAYKSYKKALEIAPIDIAMEHLVPTCLDLGRFDEAYSVASKYIKMSRKAGSDELDLALMPGALAAYHLKKYSEALDYIDEVIKTFPDSAYVAEAHRLKAMIYRAQGRDDDKGDLEEAVKICTATISKPGIPADIPGAYYERGLDYFDLGEYGKALEDFKYLVENPKVTDREVAHENYYLEGYVALSCTLSQLGRNGEAKGTLQEALNQLKKDPELQGWNRYKRRDVEGLLNRLEKGGAIPIPMMYQALGK